MSSAGSATDLAARAAHCALAMRASLPDNLGIAHEDDWYDLFVAWAPTRHVSVTLAYADLGNIVIADNQRGVYASLQVGF